MFKEQHKAYQISQAVINERKQKLSKLMTECWVLKQSDKDFTSLCSPVIFSGHLFTLEIFK